jgi:hypothetical protein
MSVQQIETGGDGIELVAQTEVQITHAFWMQDRKWKADQVQFGVLVFCFEANYTAL